MVLKIERHTKETHKNILFDGEIIIFDKVDMVRKFNDEIGATFLEVFFEDKAKLALTEPITRINDDGNFPSLVKSVYLMNDKGETIERIV